MERLAVVIRVMRRCRRVHGHAADRIGHGVRRLRLVGATAVPFMTVMLFRVVMLVMIAHAGLLFDGFEIPPGGISLL